MRGTPPHTYLNMSDNTYEPTRGGFSENTGRFSPDTQSYPDVSFDAAKVSAEIDFEWTEHNVLLTPRHRKPVDVSHEGRTTITVPIVDAESAPVGLIVADHEYVGENFEVVNREYRSYNDQLYREQLTGRRHGDLVDATPEWLAKQASAYGRLRVDGQTLSEAEEAAQKSVSGYISVDGRVWEVANEPVYRTMTFGLGGNHGGTSLSIGTAPETTSNAGDEFYHPLDQYDAAVEYAVAVATERGDSLSIDSIRTSPRSEVLDPTLIGRTWNPATHIDYVKPYDLTKENFAQEMALFRIRIEAVPGAVKTVDDGVGGTVRQINYEVLSGWQEADYKDYVKFGAELGLV